MTLLSIHKWFLQTALACFGWAESFENPIFSMVAGSVLLGRGSKHCCRQVNVLMLLIAVAFNIVSRRSDVRGASCIFEGSEFIVDHMTVHILCILNGPKVSCSACLVIIWLF